jgi:cytochrome bd ubiquinol oxidase subunit II
MNELLPLFAGIFLVVALSAYVLFGGADFGGGILERTLPTEALRARLQKTLAPVWEANHVWLIAVVVILFVGFPGFFGEAMTRLYVPISLALLAIVLRGAFFALRKYDPAPGGLLPLYSFLFRASSFLAPVCFGFLIAGLFAIHPDPNELRRSSFGAVYVAPWFDIFGVLAALFITSLFGFLAAVFFFGEIEAGPDRELIAARIRVFFLATFFLGGAVLAFGVVTKRVDPGMILHPAVFAAQVVAFFALLAFVHAYRRRHAMGLRLAAGAQTLAILAGWFGTQYPNLLRYRSSTITVYSAAAPPITLKWLLIGLVFVLALVVPLLVLLYRVFDKAAIEEAPE